MSEYRVEQGNTSTGTCDCCDQATTMVTGFVYRDEVAHAVYYLRWTVDKPEDGGVMAVSVGKWAGNAPPAERSCVGLECRPSENGPAQFRVVDAKSTPWGGVEMLGKKLTRAQAMGSPISKAAFAVIDAVVAQDRRTEHWFHGA